MLSTLLRFLFTNMLGEVPTAVTAALRDFLGRGMGGLSFCSVECGHVPAFVEAGYLAPGTHGDCVFVGEKATLAGAGECR